MRQPMWLPGTSAVISDVHSSFDSSGPRITQRDRRSSRGVTDSTADMNRLRLA